MTVMHVVGIVLAVRFETLTTPTMAFDHCRYGLITIMRVVSVVSVVSIN